MDAEALQRLRWEALKVLSFRLDPKEDSLIYRFAEAILELTKDEEAKLR